MELRKFKGIPFMLFRVFEDRDRAKYLAEAVRNQGYYARVIAKNGKFEVWVSRNPQWFYSFGEKG